MIQKVRCIHNYNCVIQLLNIENILGLFQLNQKLFQLSLTVLYTLSVAHLLLTTSKAVSPLFSHKI